ncbi:hypothetical protein EKH55_0192 [Sinorhizobium alkalisoli]|nr:hypothetical protein EKH55_0192 [Sinorhizobium alkalisoli]
MRRDHVSDIFLATTRRQLRYAREPRETFMKKIGTIVAVLATVSGQMGTAAAEA